MILTGLVSTFCSVIASLSIFAFRAAVEVSGGHNLILITVRAAARRFIIHKRPRIVAFPHRNLTSAKAAVYYFVFLLFFHFGILEDLTEGVDDCLVTLFLNIDLKDF